MLLMYHETHKTYGTVKGYHEPHAEIGDWKESKLHTSRSHIVDRQVLKDIWKSLNPNGKSWISSGNWSDMASDITASWQQIPHGCDCYGVVCDDRLNVVELNLEGNSLRGTIPDSIGYLGHLTKLHLSGNFITGTIPQSLGWLKNLRDLALFSNKLEGPFPSFKYGWDLFDILLYNNRLTGPIDEFNQFNQLKTIQVNSNKFSGTIPYGLGKLGNLTFLDLSMNKLTGTIPSDVGNISGLVYLNLYGNQLSGEVPKSIGNLTNIKGIDLRRNLFTSLPDEVLPALKASFFFNHTRLGHNPWDCKLIPDFIFTNEAMSANIEHCSRL